MWRQIRALSLGHLHSIFFAIFIYCISNGKCLMAVKSPLIMAEAEERPIKILDYGRVSPPPNSVPSNSSLTLNLFDIPWLLLFDTVDQPKRLLFYKFPDPLNSSPKVIISSLKTSLSLALQNLYPYAAKIVLPPFPDKPRILYTDGDSVPFTVAESTVNFHELAGNHVKDVKLLHPLVPKLSSWILSEDGTCTIFPNLLAIQVTLFPNAGLCIGIHYNHTVGDGKSINNFLKSWASICRTSGDIETSLIPYLDRDHVIEDQNGLQTMHVLKEWSEAFPREPNHNPPPFSYEEVRATFIFSKENINRLKRWILNGFHELGEEPRRNVSSFVAVCAYTWVSLVKSKELDNNIGLCHFGFLADCRNRLNPPIPETYCGNCLAPCILSIEKNLLLGEHGIVFAARAIDGEIRRILENGDVMKALSKWLAYMKGAFTLGHMVTVAGSPRLTVYNTDFGWGRPKKSEVVQIDSTGAISVMESRDEEGGLEIGVALDKAAMDAFTTLFEELESFE